MIARETEEKYLLGALVKRLELQLSGCKPSIDFASPYDRDVEWFELFFALDSNTGDVLSEESIDGWQALAEILNQAVALVVERYAERYPISPSQVVGLGVCATTEWFWGDEVAEIEAMVGTVRDKDALIGLWRFAVRFAPRPQQIEGRCLAADPEVYVPPSALGAPLQERPQAPWSNPKTTDQDQS